MADRVFPTLLYVIPNAETLKPNYGPFNHIRAGQDCFRENFRVISILSDRRGQLEFKSITNKGDRIERCSNPWKGIIRDLKRLALNNSKIVSHFLEIKKLNPDVIYERSEYLDFKTLIVAKLLKIPHFYEVNWPHYYGMRQFYSSYFNRCSKALEFLAYRHSTHCFIVGGVNEINIKRISYTIVHNGIHAEKLLRPKNIISNPQKMKIAFVANLMAHHRFDLFLRALDNLNIELQSRIEIHLFGFNFSLEVYEQTLPNIDWKYHGALDSSSLQSEMHRVADFGIVPYSAPWYSVMKLYEYGRAGLIPIHPNIGIAESAFSSHEVLFFDQDEEAKGLATLLTNIFQSDFSLTDISSNFQKKIITNHTWESIFNSKAKIIKSYLKLK